MEQLQIIKNNNNKELTRSVYDLILDANLIFCFKLIDTNMVFIKIGNSSKRTIQGLLRVVLKNTDL